MNPLFGGTYLILILGAGYLLLRYHSPKKKDDKKPVSKKVTIDEKQGEPNDSHVKALADHLIDTVLFSASMTEQQEARLQKALEHAILTYVKMYGK